MKQKRINKITLEKRNEVLEIKKKYPSLTGSQLGGMCGIGRSTALLITSGKYGELDEPLKTPQKRKTMNNEQQPFIQTTTIYCDESASKAERIKSLVCDLIDVLFED